MGGSKQARQLRKRETWAEKLMWKWLRDRRFSNYKFRRQHPLGIYYLDFFCEQARLSIELDGGGMVIRGNKRATLSVISTSHRSE